MGDHVVLAVSGMSLRFDENSAILDLKTQFVGAKHFCQTRAQRTAFTVTRDGNVAWNSGGDHEADLMKL